jgi:tetratricopeptide (TPR) repeat protein
MDDAERWRKLREAFEAALGADPASREDRVKAICGPDASLQADVYHLLSATSTTDPLFDIPLARLLPQQLQPGDVLCDRFELHRLLGAGGMGEVWSVQDRQLRETVAIKTLIGGSLAGDKLARFKREIQLARRIAHPNVCRMYDLFEDASAKPPSVFLTMEYLEGETLADRLKSGPIPVDEALAIFRDVTSGVAAAHDLGVVHRDLKPSNIMLVNDSRRAVVMDFGIARAPVVELADRHTVTGAIVGTPAYMAPEQISNGTTMPSTDVYALGLLLFEMLRGTPPYEGSNTFDSWLRRAREHPPRLHGKVNGVSRRMDVIVSKCVEYEPGARYQTARDLLEALDSPSPAIASRAGRPLLIGVVVVAAALLMIGLARVTERWLAPGAPSADALEWYDDAQQALAERATGLALKDIRRSIEQASTFAQAHVALAEINLELDMPARSQEAILTAAQLVRDRSRLPSDQATYLEGIEQLLLRHCDAAITSLLQNTDTVKPSARPYRLLAVARAMDRCGRPDDAARLIDWAGKIDARNPAVALQRAVLLGSRSRFVDGLAALDVADGLFRDRNNSEGLGEVLSLRGTFEQQQDHLPAAEEALQKAAAIARSLDDARLQIRVMLQQAIVQRKRGNTSEADKLTANAIDVAHRSGFDTLTLEGLIAAGNVHLVGGDYERARAMFERALAIADDNHHEEYQARGHLALATLFVRTMQPLEAAKAVETARPYYERVQQTRNIAIADTLLGQVAIARAQYDDAIARFTAAVQAATRSDPQREASSRDNLATALAGAGRYPEAIGEYQKTLDIYRAEALGPRQLFALLNIADLQSRLGDFSAAGRTLDDASRLRVDSPDTERRQIQVRTEIALREGRYDIAEASAVRLVTLQGSVRTAGLLVAQADLCVAQAHLHRAAAKSTCEQLIQSRPAESISVWLPLTVAAVEARWLRGDHAGANALAQMVVPVLGTISDHDVRWRLLALAAASKRPSSATADAANDLTRELRHLRLLWGENTFVLWSKRPDVRELVTADQVHRTDAS